MGITWTIKAEDGSTTALPGSLVQTDDKGQEKAFVNDNLVPVNTTTGKNRWLKVTANVTSVVTTDPTALAAAVKTGYVAQLTKTGTNANRYTILAASPTVGTAGWHADDASIIQGLKFTFDITGAGDTIANAAGITFYVTLNGGDDEQADYTGSTNNALVASLGLSIS